MTKYDIIVIGGGPAGLYASINAYNKNTKILVLEKDREIGKPIICAEGISNRTLDLFFEKNDFPFIRNKFKELVLKYNDAISYTHIPDMGIVVNRSVFDRYIADIAIEKGIEIKTSENVLSAKYIDNGVEIITENNTFTAKMIIIADGVESRIASFFNMDSATDLNDIYACYQYIMRDESINDKEIIFDFSPEFARYGYIWLFPRGNKEVNFGIGVIPNLSTKKPDVLLKKYKEKYYPNGEILRETAGAVPINPMKKIFADRVLVCGDAARYADPLTGGGIDNALRTGQFAGQIAKQSITKNDFSEKFLSQYDKDVKRDNWFFISKQLKLKNIIERMDDDELNKFFKLTIESLNNKTIYSDDFYSSLFSFSSMKNRMQLIAYLSKMLITKPFLLRILLKLL